MAQYLKSWPDLTVFSSALIFPSPAGITPHLCMLEDFSRLTLLRYNTFSANMLGNSHFYSFASFWIVSLTSFINKLDSLRNLIILIISSISLFEMSNVVMLYPNILFWMAAWVADAAVVNPNNIKTLLANFLLKFFY